MITEKTKLHKIIAVPLLRMILTASVFNGLADAGRNRMEARQSLTQNVIKK